MSDAIVNVFSDPSFIIAMLVAVAVFATIFTVMPALSGDDLGRRMKSVALEREELRAKQRARLAAEAENRRKGGSSGLREVQSGSIKDIVDRLDLRRALADENTQKKLVQAGFRGQNPMTKFLFFRFALPFVGLLLAVLYVFVLDRLPDQPTIMKLFVCICGAYAGFYAPNLYINNLTSKRKKSIQRAWPDALDLMLICVEAGMTVETAFRKVSDEIGTQSAELAEELVLTTAELSYLPERRQAFENLTLRTGLETVKSVSQALIQAERYGTPVAQALRVLSAESREMRMNEAEKKAAALPPKLTVPMILFFLPVLFAVILGPAGIAVSENGGIFG